MRIVFVMFFLSVRSSYARNEELDATDEEFDTVQFVGSEQGTWRIKTFALDQDVHPWSMKNAALDDLIAVARQNTETHYGDVLTEGYVIDTPGGIEGLRQELRARGLSDHLEIGENGMMFWAPEGTEYRTRTRPTHAKSSRATPES